jgi:hypothetical protein
METPIKYSHCRFRERFLLYLMCLLANFAWTTVCIHVQCPTQLSWPAWPCDDSESTSGPSGLGYSSVHGINRHLYRARSYRCRHFVSCVCVDCPGHICHTPCSGCGRPVHLLYNLEISTKVMEVQALFY